MARLPAYEARGEREGVGPLQPGLAVTRGVLRRPALKEDKTIRCGNLIIMSFKNCRSDDWYI